MNTSASIKNLATALIEAQTELANPTKSQQGYGYRYADLSSIIDLVKPVLKKNKLAITQTSTDDGNGNVGVTTTLMHDSGEYISDTLRLPIPEMKGTTSTQAAGAALTYARRYAISSILNIAADEDTDAADVGTKNGAVSRSSVNIHPSLQRNSTPKPPAQSTGQVTKCTACGATGKFHAPGCPNAN